MLTSFHRFKDSAFDALINTLRLRVSSTTKDHPIRLDVGCERRAGRDGDGADTTSRTYIIKITIRSTFYKLVLGLG